VTQEAAVALWKPFPHKAEATSARTGGRGEASSQLSHTRFSDTCGTFGSMIGIYGMRLRSSAGARPGTALPPR